MTKSKEFYVYSLSSPITGDVFYIGKGKGDRIDHHERDARANKGYNEHKLNTIRGIISQGLKVQKKIIKRFECGTKAYNYESDLIRSTKGLTNITQNSHRKPPSETLTNLLIKIVNRTVSRSYANKYIKLFFYLAQKTNHQKDYLIMVKGAYILANKNKWLSTECNYA